MRIRKSNQTHFLIALTGAFLLSTGCEAPSSTDSGDGHTAAAEEDYERGPNNGRMLRDGDLALEITIFETGVPPEFRVYPYRDGQPLTPDQVDLTIELGRLGLLAEGVDRTSHVD